MRVHRSWVPMWTALVAVAALPATLVVGLAAPAQAVITLTANVAFSPAAVNVSGLKAVATTATVSVVDGLSRLGLWDVAVMLESSDPSLTDPPIQATDLTPNAGNNATTGTWTTRFGVGARANGTWTARVALFNGTLDEVNESDPTSFDEAVTSTPTPLVVVGSALPKLTMGIKPSPLPTTGGYAVQGRAVRVDNGVPLIGARVRVTVITERLSCEDFSVEDANGLTDSNGFYKVTTNLPQPLRFVEHCARIYARLPTGEYVPVVTKYLFVVGQPSLGLVVPAAAVKAGRLVEFTGNIAPAARCTIRLQRWVSGSWATVQKVTSRLSGRFTFSTIPRQPGTNLYRSFSEPCYDHGFTLLFNSSSPRKVRVVP